MRGDAVKEARSSAGPSGSRHRVRAGLVLIGLVIVLAAPTVPQAQPPRGADTRLLKPEELEQIVAPIVQYPDPLVAQIFMASTYPLQVVEAARFAKANPTLKGAALNEELKKRSWTIASRPS